MRTPAPSPTPAPNRSWVVALSLIGVAVLGLAAFAAWQLNRSKRYLDVALSDFQRQGAALDVDGCVRAVLAWRPTCGAMASMCDNALGQMTDTCLSAQDRSPYCAAQRPQDADNHAVNDLCLSLGVPRKQRAEWKQCGMVIEGLREHCRNLDRLAPPQASPRASVPSPSIAHTPAH